MQNYAVCNVYQTDVIQIVQILDIFMNSVGEKYLNKNI